MLICESDPEAAIDVHKITVFRLGPAFKLNGLSRKAGTCTETIPDI